MIPSDNFTNYVGACASLLEDAANELQRADAAAAAGLLAMLGDGGRISIVTTLDPGAGLGVVQIALVDPAGQAHVFMRRTMQRAQDA